jgi:hypothetical protein
VMGEGNKDLKAQTLLMPDCSQSASRRREAG